MAKRALHIALWLLAFVSAIVTVFGVEILLALQGKKSSPFENPSHAPVRVTSSGPLLTYAVIGDSTAAGQGAPYSTGIAIGTTNHLAKHFQVTMTNLGISGATTADVIAKELPQATALHPDLVLLAVGANDATHFVPSQTIKANLEEIVSTLRLESPSVKIVVTGCPQLGSVPRFLQPLRWFAGTQTKRVNNVFKDVVSEKHLYWCHIADETGPIFQQDPTLFASDDFHPNARGYAVWLLALNKTLDKALQTSVRENQKI